MASGGVGMYIRDDLRYTVLEKCSNNAFQALWVEIELLNKPNIICGVIYRQHNTPESFQTYFENAMDKFSALRSNKPIYVMGDFNINLLKAQTCKYTQDFLSILQSYALTPTIDKPTRVCYNSATLIDNIFVNKIEDPILSGNVVSDVSDHFSQFCIIQSSMTTKCHRQNKVRDFSHFSQSRLNNDLIQIDWKSVIDSKRENIDKLFATFYDKLNKLSNKHAPLKKMSKCKIKQSVKLWITKAIRRSIKIKNKLFYSGNKDKY